MSLNLKLQMRLSQQLIMTPQLQQAIKLLQLSRQELEELIDQALIENPVLEESPPENNESLDEALPAAETDAMAPQEDVIEDHTQADNDVDWQQYLASGSGVIPERHARDSGEESNLEATLSRSDTLHEHLLWQLEMAPLTPLEKTIGRLLIGNMDDDGYLTSSILELLESDPELHRAIEQALRRKRLTVRVPADLDPALLIARHQSSEPEVRTKGRKKALPAFAEEEAEAAAQAERPRIERIKVKPEVAGVMEGVLRQIQQFDPIGVGARHLQECLEVQLRALGMGVHLAYQIVHHDLKLLENKDLKKIARRRKAELDDVIEAYKLIMYLEPKPGRPFVRDRAQTIIPDVYIHKVYGDPDEDGEDRYGQYKVTLNDTGITRLRISDFYREMADNGAGNSSLTQEYIQEKIKAGNWLMKSIEQRQKTILRVTRSILKHQYEFFEQGINYLRPLVLKDVAEDIDVHESTVSRITTNKYAHTPQGIFELKYFFTSGIDQGQGEVISSKKIKDMILRIISGEDAREPLTDIQIAERLSNESKIKVARRTVAKYREALNLLPSNKRKKMF
ncbi:MAG TPA: RNA polymerase factor sigma-54 [bacterium]|nr:RNA polymerase factor sigma-54 [bacterium]